MSKRLKSGQEILFIDRNEEKRVISYRKGKFIYSKGGSLNRCIISTIENGKKILLSVPRSQICTSEQEVRDEVLFIAGLFEQDGWRAEI